MSNAFDRFLAAASGTPAACFPIAPGDLATLAGGTVVDVAADAVSGPAAS